MHVLLTIVGGLLLLAVFALFGKQWGGDASGSIAAAKLFLPAWLLMAIVNMWVGVTRAGYTVREELPILLLVFAVPAAAAWLVIAFLPRA